MSNINIINVHHREGERWTSLFGKVGLSSFVMKGEEDMKDIIPLNMHGLWIYRLAD